MPIKTGNSDDERDVAQHIVDFYESKGFLPADVIDKVSIQNAPYIPDSLRDIIAQEELGIGIREVFKEPPEVPEPELPERRAEEWTYPYQTEIVSVPRDKSGKFAKGKRIVQTIRRVLIAEGPEPVQPAEILEESFEPEELGEEYRNEQWSYPEYLGGQTREISVPRDAKGKFLKGRRVVRKVITSTVAVDDREYELYQDFGATG